MYFQKLDIVETLMHEAQKMPLKFYRDSNKGKSNNIYELDLDWTLFYIYLFYIYLFYHFKFIKLEFSGCFWDIC